MKKYKKHLFVVLVFLVFILFIYSSYFQEEGEARSTLYWGTRGGDVYLLQRRLSEWGYYDGRISGIFGNETAAAVRQFQARNGLRVDGVVGPETWEAIGYTVRRAAPAAPATTAVSRHDNLNLLARVVNAEARGEPYEGQVAVAAVMLNRIESPEFPNTLSGVVYQPLAFESVADGQVNLAPDQSSIRAAQAALNGWDPTYGALFFWNPGKPVNPWVWTRETIRTIGNHIFAY